MSDVFKVLLTVAFAVGLVILAVPECAEATQQSEELDLQRRQTAALESIAASLKRLEQKSR